MKIIKQADHPIVEKFTMGVQGFEKILAIAIGQPGILSMWLLLDQEDPTNTEVDVILVPPEIPIDGLDDWEYQGVIAGPVNILHMFTKQTKGGATQDPRQPFFTPDRN